MTLQVKGKLSSPHCVTSGVPQGSVLGPILFLIYVNHVASNLSCHYKVFADDLKMYMKIRHNPQASFVVDSQVGQRDIDMLQNTAESWCQVSVFEC